jgi:hypothetical protein
MVDARDLEDAAHLGRCYAKLVDRLNHGAWN